jgi:hypothetical protein
MYPENHIWNNSHSKFLDGRSIACRRKQLSCEFNVHVLHRKNILIYRQQDATLHCLFYLETVLFISDGTTIYHQKRIQLYLQHLVFVTPLLLPAAIQF